jgi:hypothetical protein
MDVSLLGGGKSLPTGDLYDLKDLSDSASVVEKALPGEPDKRALSAEFWKKQYPPP